MLKIDYSDRSIVDKFDSILSRGLCNGVGNRDGQMCIEAAICAVLNLPHGDDPQCVETSVRLFKIRLNDSRWSSPAARAKGLRDLGLAQIGSKGIVDGKKFSKRVAEQTIRVLIPKLYRELFPSNSRCLEAANRCEIEGSANAAAYAANAAYAAYAVYAANAANTAYAAAYAANAVNAANTAYAAAYAANAAYTANAANAANAAYAANADQYLILSANIALQVLKDLKSPGCAFLET